MLQDLGMRLQITSHSVGKRAIANLRNQVVERDFVGVENVPPDVSRPVQTDSTV